MNQHAAQHPPLDGTHFIVAEINALFFVDELQNIFQVGVAVFNGIFRGRFYGSSFH